jgi:tetratricopeptide (TPR) repeat protein
MIAGSLRVYRLDDADALIRRWQHGAPDNAHAEYSRGFLAELRNHALEAIESYRRAVELDAEHVDARYRLASVLLELSQAQEAVPHLRWLAERHPTYVSVLVDLARGLDQLGQQDEAERYLARARELRPNHADTWLESGILAMRREQHEQAESWLRAACALAPGDYRSHYQLSLCLERLGKVDEARDLLPRVKQLEADNARRRAIIGRLLPRAPNDPNLHYDLGMIALRADSIPEALRWFESALAADPRHEPTHQALAGHYQRSGQMARAARHLEFVKSKTNKVKG